MSFGDLSRQDHLATVHFRYFMRLTARMGAKPGSRPTKQLPPLQKKWLLGYCYGRRMRGGLR